MMEFIMMTISFAVGILLAMAVAFAVMLQPKVLKWYMSYATKVSNQIVEEMFKDDEAKDL